MLFRSLVTHEVQDLNENDTDLSVIAPSSIADVSTTFVNDLSVVTDEKYFNNSNII